MRSKAVVVAALLIAACRPEPEPTYPYGPLPPPPPARTAPMPSSSTNTTAAHPLGALLGSAVTAFGILLQQVPAVPAQLPPLPPIHDWSAMPWPFPWTAPMPSPQPNPTPTPTPTDGWPASWTAFEDDVLRRTNERRATGAVCGGQAMAPAPPVVLHVALRSAARGHSRDMATRDYFDHTSPEGKGPSNRAVEAGYRSTFVGENIAAGQPDPARVVDAWVTSAGHCVNMMDPRYRVLGVGYFFDDADRFAHYWTQNFGG